MRHPFLFILLFLIQFSFFTGVCELAATEQEVQFKDITITTSNSHLLLFGIVKNDKNSDMEQALHSGIPMRFKFFIELFRTKENWPDEELISMEFTHILKYDTLKEHYQVDLEEQKKKTSTYHTFQEALQVMNEINGLRVVELNKLLPDSSYELRMKAVLYKKILPMNLHYVIPFVSLWNVETDWHTIEFTY
jgi:Domain of unknown function (DUF4390)